MRDSRPAAGFFLFKRANGLSENISRTFRQEELRAVDMGIFQRLTWCYCVGVMRWRGFVYWGCKCEGRLTMSRDFLELMGGECDASKRSLGGW